VCRPVEHALDTNLDLLADERRSIRDADVEAVELPDACAPVVQPDLAEAQLDLGTLLDRCFDGELVPLALREHDEVVDVRALLADEVEAPPRLGLELRQALGAGADEQRRHLARDLDAIRLCARSRREYPEAPL